MHKTCSSCGRSFDASRAAAKYCGDTCRKRAQRRPKPSPLAPASPMQAGSLVAATRAELERAGRVDSAAGQASLALATRVDAGTAETGSSMAALVREYRATLADAVRDAQGEADPLDEVRARRERKLASG